MRRIAGAAALGARQRRVQRFAWLNRGDIPLLAAVQAATEGIALSAFSPDRYKSGERGAPPIDQVLIVAVSVDHPAEVEAAIERGRILGESSNIARELSNEPSNVLTPAIFAERATEICEAAGVSVEVLDERAIAKLGMGLLLGVSRGSAEPPRVIVMRHRPAGAPAAPVLGLVGKGITFDTGGISIKPADGMERMKDDMAGGAAVVCAMRAISLLNAPINVIGVVPTTENMPGGRALKPGDVLTSASGKTVEVINTDAEGRLILGDGLWYAQQLGATHLVDVATLTGAAVVALGKVTSAIFGQPTAWVDVVRQVVRGRRRSLLAHAPVRRVCRAAEERDRRHAQHRRPAGGRLHRRHVPEGIRRRAAVGPPRRGRHGVVRRSETVDGEGRERRRRSRACGTRLHQREVAMMIQQAPIIVHVVQPPIESTTVGDVLIGAIGLTGLLVLVALLLGSAFGGALIGIKILRRRRNAEAEEQSEIIHIF